MADHNFLPLSRQLFTPGNTNVLYGPWDSQQDFFDFCEEQLIELYRGIVFGVIQNNGTVKEYGNKDTESVSVFVEIGTASYDIETLRHKVAIRELINGLYSDTDAKVRVLKDERVIEFEDENGYIERITVPEITLESDFSDDFGDDFFNEHKNAYDLSLFQTEHDDRIQLEDKTVVGALNVLNGKLKGIPAPARQKYRGEITLQNLLATTDAQDGDAYAVYAKDTEDGTMSMLDYEYGTNRTAGTIFERANGNWIVPDVTPDFTGVVKMNERPEKISVIKSLFPETSYKNLYGNSMAGMLVATVEDYVIDENGVYQKVVYDKGTPGQRYYSKSSEQKIVVPYARAFAQGLHSEMVYTGGLLTASDYQRLMENLITKDFFVAYYGRTTHAKIKEANNEGKVVLLKKNTEIYLLTSAATSTDPSIKEGYTFSKVRENQILLTIVNNENAWSSAIINLLRETDIKTSEEGWSGTSDMDVPSTKLVKETFDALPTVAKTGDYNDLRNKPTIQPAVTDAVKYSAQSLTEEQKAQARQNIGAGTSSFSGDYSDLANKPAIPDSSDFVTIAGQQTIQGKKTFDNYQWGQITVRAANGSYYDSPCISFQATVGQVTEGVGSIGVRRTSYLTGYPAYWASDNGNPQRLIREDERGSELTPIYIDSYGKTHECNLYDYVVFEQTGTYYTYSFTRIGGTEGVNVLFDIMESSASVSDMLICISISGMITATAYSEYMKTHIASVFLTGNGAGLSQQVNVLRRAWVTEETAYIDAKIVLQLNTEVFEPNPTNRFVVKFEHIGI